MRIGDLVLVLSFFLVLGGLLGALVALAARRRRLAGRLAIGLVAYLGPYALALVGVSLASPQQVLRLHQPRCFDDWCASVEGLEQRPDIGGVRSQGTFYLVTLRVSSRAKRITQRARDARVSLVDGSGRRYDPSPAGERALGAAGGAGEPLDSFVAPGGSFTHVAVFDLPADVVRPALVVNHGAFPGLIVIGDPQSFLHKPTIVDLSADGPG
jgi:hypothetical protein